MNSPVTNSGNPSAPVEIQAVDFQPSQVATQTRRWSVWHWLLGLVALVALAALWFMFTSRSVTFELQPKDAVAQSIDIQAALQLQLGAVNLLRAGNYPVSVKAAGFEPLTTDIVVTDQANQRVLLNLTPLPGLVTLDATPVTAKIKVHGEPELTLGNTPLTDLPLAAGAWRLEFSAPNYETQTLEVSVEGRERKQTFSATLLPNWADVSVTSAPDGAEIFIDEESTGLFTPAVVPVPSGEHEIRLKKPGHRSHQQRLYISARQPMALDPVSLVRADSLLTIRTQPAGAGITLNGKFRGEAPLELALKSGQAYRVRAFKSGYESTQQQLTLESGAERDLDLKLPRLTGSVAINVLPANAQVYVDGKLRGTGDQQLTLPSRAHKIEVKLPGYAGYTKSLTPKSGLKQALKVKLLTIADARIAALQPQVTTKSGQTLVLMKPNGTFKLGASRREPGRRANEVLREVQLDRLYYLGTHEVTNAQFQAFTANHDAGEFEGQELGKPDLPVAGVTWTDAAMYCNWLSKQEGLTPFYQFELGTLKGWNTNSIGYRLPTEAEWTFGAQQKSAEGSPLRFPWGSRLPPPDRHGNYADRSAAHAVGRIIFGYNDNHIAAAPVGTFAANKDGLFDMGGNVSEWMTDYYEIPSADEVTNPIGPSTGEYHVIKGSSWMHGSITDLRIMFRDYGSDSRQDLGFRIARYAESK